MWYGVIVMCFVFLFLFLCNPKTRGIIIEYAAWLWLKLALVLATVYVVNVVFSYMAWHFFIPINVFSVITITFLGVPGAACIIILMIMKKS